MRIATIAALLLIIMVGTYAFFRGQSFLFGPTLVVLSPEPHRRMPHTFTLHGQVKNSTYLAINDQRIYPDKKGFFEKDLALAAGYTIVKLYAHNRQKREQIIYLPLYIQPHDPIQENSDKESEKSVSEEEKE